jgi:23S rRNA (cytosine1962-C5)-methyltransferase
MSKYPRIILKKGKEAAIKRFHPWLFSGAIRQVIDAPEEGDVVEIFTAGNEYLASGHYCGGSIAVKIFTWQQQEINLAFWKEKLQSALLLRRSAGLTESPLTNAYRLVFSEGDELPGLIIDWYNGVAVIQTHSVGMHRVKSELVKVLQELYGTELKAVYDKSSETMHHTLSDPGDNLAEDSGVAEVKRSSVNQYLYGSSVNEPITEMGHRFYVDWEKGQKTGFFLDQRNNRMFAQYYAKGKKVLNAFCYSGAFSIYALKGGASLIHSVDSSGQALQLLEKNLRLNNIEPGIHTSFQEDVKNFLFRMQDPYDMIILDPPAFAKHHNVSHNALQGYVRINAEAMKKIAPGGILMSFSCSQAVSREMFQGALLSAALECGRKMKILHHLSQGPDHPVNIYHPEGEYLKGLIVYIE